MTDKIDVATARKSLAELIQRANAGEEFIITRYGKEMAKLVPFEKSGLQTTLDYIDYIQENHDRGKNL